MRILLPIDGSLASDHATHALLKYLPELKHTPQIDLLYVALPVLPAVTVHGVAVDQAAISAHYEKEMHNATARAREALKAAGVAFGVSMEFGDPAEQICLAAVTKECHMIWMGTRGMGGFANLILGSIATKVLHQSKVPVTLTPIPHPTADFISGRGFTS